MASFDLSFSPRTIDYDSSAMRTCASDLEILNARVLGRADDLGGSFDSAAAQFTDLVAWDIKDLSEEDRQYWRDAAVTVTYAASVAEMWADTIDAFRTERDDQITAWENTRAEKASAVPGTYQGQTITSSYPEADGWWFTDWGAGDEIRCRELYDELRTTRDNLDTRERTNWQNLQDGASEIREMLEQGPTPVNVQKLIEAGNAGWAFLSLDPSRYSSLIEDGELTPENAEEFAEELNAYWSGDKPLDDRYHEIMLVMSMLGTSARQHQRNGTGLTSEEIAFLEEFYDQLEDPYRRDDGLGAGIMVYPDLMAESGMSDEEREEALGTLGDGLLALSDPRIGGGYDRLPESFRHAVEGPWINPDAENKLPGTPVSMGMDMRALSALLQHTDEGMEGGYGLSTNLHLATGAFLDAWGDTSDPDGVLPDSEQVSHLIDVASRNEDANYYLLTGNHLDPEPGVDHGDDELRTRALEGTLTHEWHDDGATARQLVDWMHEDLASDDYQEVSRAGRAFAGFMETITDPDMHDALTNTGVDVTEGDNEYSDASFTQYNGELADGLADIFDAHIYSFANGDVLDHGDEAVDGIGSFEHDRSYVRMGADQRAMYMQLLMGNDATAGRVVNSVDAYQQIESIAFLESGNEATSARGAGQLQGLLERALYLESENRGADLDEQIERRTQITEFVVSEATGLTEKIPVIGAAVSKGMGLAEESIVNAVVDGEYEISPRFPTYTSDESVQRNFSVETLDYIVHNSPDALNGETQRADLRALVAGGALTVEQDGRVLSASDITNDFVIDHSVTMSFEKDPNEWSDNEDDELAGMDDAISNIMDTASISATYADPHTGEPVHRSGPGRAWVEDFTEVYGDAYNETRDYFEGDLETFGTSPNDG
ncbi:hypothetical protein AB0I72_22675 [Nocardiopsis sp. NPDC049922]|uniref:TPR repeat region-containing protein n=1 Tax=Nocardiopsis sp. NPDC049922 TaxID=3155157 RepID=UPI0033ECA263